MATSIPLRKKTPVSYDIKDIDSKVSPNYLKASISSCHDYCKYGKRRDVTVMTQTIKPEELPMSPNKGRELDKSNYLQKKNSLLSPRSPSTIRSSVHQVREKEIQAGVQNLLTPRSPSTVRSSVHQIREKEIQAGVQNVAVTAKNPHKLKIKTFETKGATNSGQNNGTAKSPYKVKMKPFETKGATNNVRNNGINASKQPQTPKGSKKLISMPASGSPTNKPKVRKVLKGACRFKCKETITKPEIEPTSIEDVPEKIICIAELNSENQAAGFTPKENICVDSLQCQNQTEFSSSASLLQETEDVECVDKEIDPVQFSPCPSSAKEGIGSQSNEGGDISKSSSSSLVSHSLLSSFSAAEADCSPPMGTQDVYHKSNENGNENENEDENESSKVVLRHQNAEQKIPTEGLFNDVIEETAKKLVKTRNGKVKALVSAFESIISLQDLSLQEQSRCGDSPRLPYNLG